MPAAQRQTGGADAEPVQPGAQADEAAHDCCDLVGCLAGPATANFDLFPDQWTGRAWKTVAKSTNPGSQENVTFNGKARFYRYRVALISGGGAYTIAGDML